MWALATFNRALRQAIRLATVIARMMELREVDGGMFLPSEDAVRARLLAQCRRPAGVVANVFHQSMTNALDDAWVEPESLPPRLREQQRPPRHNPGRTPLSMLEHGVSFEEQLRELEGEDGRGRDRTPRSAMERDHRRGAMLQEIAASSHLPPPGMMTGGNPSADDMNVGGSEGLTLARTNVVTTTVSTTSFDGMVTIFTTTWGSLGLLLSHAQPQPWDVLPRLLPGHYLRRLHLPRAQPWDVPHWHLPGL